MEINKRGRHESREMRERIRISSQIMPPLKSEEYERSVDKEAERLGFAKELLAYDIQS